MSEIKPIEQKQIMFQGREITAVLVQDTTGRENIYVPLRPLVEGMGMQWSAQLKRIRRNPVLNDVCEFVSVMDTNSKRGNPNKLAIPISKLNGFLFGINANRVKAAYLLTEQEKPQNVEENETIVQRAGKVAGDSRRNFEEVTGKRVVSSSNNLDKIENPSLDEGE